MLNSLIKMKMNPYIITAAVLALPAGFITYKMIKEQKKKKTWLALAKAYERLLWDNKLTVEHSEILNEKVIALDRRNKKLILIDHNRLQPMELCISLGDVVATRIVETRDEMQECIKSINLELQSRSGHAVQFCFYNVQQDDLFSLKPLKRKALQWKTRIDVHRNSGNVNMQMEYVV